MGPVRRLATDYARAFKLFSRDARLFLLGNFLAGIGSNLVSLLLSLYLKRRGYDEADIGTFLSIRAMGSVLVALPASFLVAKLNPRALLPAAAVLAAAAYSAQALASSGPGIGAGVLLGGAFVAVFQVAGGPLLMRCSGKEERTHLFALNGALSFGTGVIGSLIAGLVKDGLAAATGDELFAYRATILLGAVFLLSALLPFSLISVKGPASAQSGSAVPPSDAARRGALARLFGFSGRVEPLLYMKALLPNFLLGIGAGLTIPYINLYFKNVFAMSDAAIGAAVAAGQIATFVGIASGPSLSRRIGKRKSIVLTQAVSVPFILVLTYAKAFPLVAIAYLIRQSLMNLSNPLQDNFILELVPQDQQQFMNALKMVLWTGSWMIAARISGILIKEGGFAPSFTVTAALYAASTASFWTFFIRGTKDRR
jgi:MFS family permease